MHPFAKDQAANSGQAKTSNERATDQRDAPFIVRHPGRGVADRVGNIRGHEHPAKRDDCDGEQPEVPRHHKTGEVVETEFCPLINPAFKRHLAIQINDDRGLWNVKEHNGEQPKEKVRLSEFSRGADPARADHEKDLGQDQIAKAKRLFESATLLFNAALGAI